MSAVQKAYQQKVEGPVKAELNDAAEMPTAGPNEVVIKNHAAGVNPIDWKATEGAFAQGRPFPVTCGVDGAGIVESVGEGVTDFKKGDKVFYLTDLGAFGAYAQYSKTGASTVYKVPDEWNLTEAGTAGCVLFTAIVGIYDKLNVQANETVFINGGAGGVGCVAIQLAAARGAKVITTCSARNTEFVKSLGASEVIDYTKEDIVARTKELTGGAGANKVFDCVSTEPAKLVPLTAFNGAIATILPFAIDGAVAFPLFQMNISVHPILVLAYAGYGAAKLKAMVPEVYELIKNKKFKIPIQKKYAFDETQAALEANKSGSGIQGKIVIIIDESLA